MAQMSEISLTRISIPVGAVVGVVVAAFGVQTYADNRYSPKEDTARQVFQVKESIVDLHRARLQDEIFKLELIAPQKRTQADKAMLDRYKSQLQELDSKRERDR
jgi:hypothetical protein